MDKFGANQPIGFPNTAYYLPIIYSILGIKIEKLGDAEPVLKICRELLPPHIKTQKGIHLPYLGGTLDSGMAAILADKWWKRSGMWKSPIFITWVKRAIRKTEKSGLAQPTTPL